MANITSSLEQLDLSRLQEPSKLHRQDETGVASVYQFDIKEGAKVYRYDVEVTKRFKETVKSLSTGGADDGLKYRFRMICEDAVQEFFKQTNGLGGGQFIYAFDGRKNLIANGNLNIPKSITFGASVLPKRSRDVLSGAEIAVEIQPCTTDQSVIVISDIEPALQKCSYMQADHTLRMILELLTTQPFLNAGTHSIVGAGKIFENDNCKKLENGVVLHRGIAKGARIIENYGNPVPALVVDVKTCAFYEPITLDLIHKQIVREQRGGGGGQFWDRFVSFLRGVRVEVTYDPSRTFVFWDVTMRSIGEMTIEKDGRSMKLLDYYKNEKNITIDDPSLLGVRPEGKKDKDTCYPFQCCRILPFQRVTIDRMSDKISRELLNANTTQPQVRFNAIETAARRIGDPQNSNGQFLMKFGVKLVGNKSTIKIGIRNPPMIAFGNKEVGPKNGKFDERFYKYYSCSNILGSLVVGHPRAVVRNDVERFVNMLMDAAGNKGLKLPKPEFTYIELGELEDKIKDLSAQKKQFLLYIDAKIAKSHGILKVCEKRYSVITQHVTYEMIQKAGGASVTNVLNKLHMKISFQTGLNYLPKMEKVGLAKFDLSTGKVLVIGLDSSNAPRATPFERFHLKKENVDADSLEPTVIGICANYVKQTHSFCGTYFYQPAKQDAILATKLHEAVTWVLKMVKKNRNNGPGPGLIVIIRDGVAEGQVPNAVKNEFVAIRDACLKFAPGYIPKFVFCVVDKSHNKRLFLGTKDQQKQNLTPSSVVDAGIVRPDINEFYMQSHCPLKGTAKVPQYVFPINEVKASNDELQALINCLCHSWQIVNLAPSLPTPVLQAHELAKRGRNNYQELKRMEKVPKLPNLQIDYDTLNARLSYENHKFADTRFNA